MRWRAPRSAQDNLHPKGFSKRVQLSASHACHVSPVGKRQLPWLVAFVTQVHPHFSWCMCPSIQPCPCEAALAKAGWMPKSRDGGMAAGEFASRGRYFPGNRQSLHCPSIFMIMRRIKRLGMHNMAALPCWGRISIRPLPAVKHMLSCIGVQAHSRY